MRERLQFKIEENSGVCQYVENCPVLSGLNRNSLEEGDEHYNGICKTEAMYNCVQFCINEGEN